MDPAIATLISNTDQNWALLVDSYRQTLAGGGSAIGLAIILGNQTTPAQLAQRMVNDRRLAKLVQAMAWTALGEVIQRAEAVLREELENENLGKE